MAAESTERPDEQQEKGPYILTLDVGTSSTRALLFDAQGRAVSGIVAQHTYELTTSREGEVSVDADKLVDLVAQTIDEALQQAGAREIIAVATDTFWHSLVGVDASNRALTPVITWEDTRPHMAAQQLRAEINVQALHERTGATLHASYWPAKLRWLAAARPDVFTQAAQWLSFGEYLHRRFLGRSVCSLSMASGTGMLQTRARAWDSELQKALGVRPEQFPPLGDLRDAIKGLTPDYAKRWPALQNVPWFPAIGDGAAANVGSGCTTPSRWALTIGTSSAMRVILPPEQVVPPQGLWLYLLDARRAVFGGALSEGGNLLTWLLQTLRLPERDEAEQQAADLPPDAHGLTILPFPSGERSLGWHADARMTIFGLSLHTTPAELLRAGSEALAYQIFAVYTRLLKTLRMQENPPQLICSGRALLSTHALQQILADTLNTPLYPSRESEASARGVALLALEALDLLPDVTRVEPELDAPVQPDEKRGRIYREGAERQEMYYRWSYPAMADEL